MKLQAQHIGFDNAVAILNQGIQAIDSGDSVMDMQDVRKTDSAAVAVVLEWIRRAQARGAELKVINAPDSFQNLVKLYSLSDLIISGTPTIVKQFRSSLSSVLRSKTLFHSFLIV